MTSSFLSGFNSLSTFGFAVGYDSAGDPVQVNPTYDSAGVPHSITAAAASSAYWLAGTGGTDPATGPFDALGRLTAEKWDAGAITKGSAFLPGSNLAGSYSTTLTNAGVNTNVYSVSSMIWQGSLLASYNVSSNWEGSGTAYAAAYDADAHLLQWNATPVSSAGAATQQFNEGYTFKLENLKTVNATNSIGASIVSNYNYADAVSAERVTSVTAPSALVNDTYVYDKRGRGLVVQHKLSAAQSPAQDAYEYDSLNRLTSIAHLGVTQETLAYDGVGDLASRQFLAGSADIARYYVGDDLTLVNHNASTTTGFVHIRLGGKRLASFWCLIHLKARAYSPALRRFLQPDTIDLKRYTYAEGDPLNIVDPSGLEGEEPSDAGAREENKDGGVEEIKVTGNRLPPPSSPTAMNPTGPSISTIRRLLDSHGQTGRFRAPRRLTTLEKSFIHNAFKANHWDGPVDLDDITLVVVDDFTKNNKGVTADGGAYAKDDPSIIFIDSDVYDGKNDDSGDSKAAAVLAHEAAHYYIFAIVFDRDLNAYSKAFDILYNSGAYAEYRTIPWERAANNVMDSCLRQGCKL